MTLEELKNEIMKYQYFEDYTVIDACLAAIVATRLKLGDPIWMIVIGPSSGGKSQILRPLALTQPAFMHRIDDLTENTFLSGIDGNKKTVSLLKRIGKHGILVISDLTVLFSKNSEARSAILSQFRMLYDGEMVKHSGSSAVPISWKGSLGVLAGSTPSIYAHFEEVADMGERFIYFRLLDHDDRKASFIAMKRGKLAKEVDEKLADSYREYLKSVIEKADKITSIEIPEWLYGRIINAANFAERIRTPVHLNKRESFINRIPVTAKSTRVALQLLALAKGLAVIHGGISEKDAKILEWCAWSLANEEKRVILEKLAANPPGVSVPTQQLADGIGLNTDATRFILENMAATKIIVRTGDSSNLYWRIREDADIEMIRRITGVKESQMIVSARALSKEESKEMADITDNAFEQFGK